MLAALATASLSGCNSDSINDEHHYTNKLSITSAPRTDDLLIKAGESTASRVISCRMAEPTYRDVQVNFDAAPALTATYNLIYGDSASVLEEEFYDIPVKTITIPAGSVSGDDVEIDFKNTDQLDKKKRYVLPVTIVSAQGIDVLESARTAYFVFKGAALINVVANIEKINFPINWKSNVSSLPIITVEALVRSSDWTAGRENALSSVFGIEGKFLIRIGDADRPRDQLQVVAPGGNFPDANKVEGLPVNEWTHIAIVYNSQTKERIYYKDGVKVYSDNSASGSVSLTSSCFIGKSYDDSRWLPGDISEVRVWSVARTAEQIADHPYEVDPESDGLIAYWKFNEGTGKVIADQTGHGNDITGSGDPTWVKVEIPQIH
jgi:hypothetical protein